jgi:molybdopterin converting factor small subunit
MFGEPLRPGDTVRKVLRRLSGRFPELHKALWDAQTGELGEHIEVLVNDAVLDITHTLDSPVHTGDKIALIGQYLGG